MKLTQLFEQKEENKKGTYVGAKFSIETKVHIKKFIKEHDIPNGLTSKDMHTTLIYSRKHLDKVKGIGELKEPWIGKPKKLEIFKTQNGWKALVLRYECKEQVDFHENVMHTTDATYDYPEYKTHLTLSYNIEDMDEDKLLDLDVSSIGDIEIVKLYQEDLNLDWAEKTVKK